MIRRASRVAARPLGRSLGEFFRHKFACSSSILLLVVRKIRYFSMYLSAVTALTSQGSQVQSLPRPPFSQLIQYVIGWIPKVWIVRSGKTGEFSPKTRCEYNKGVLQ